MYGRFSRESLTLFERINQQYLDYIEAYCHKAAFNKSTKVLNWCTKCLHTVEDITTVDRELPQVDNV